jgi:hypothetical protein
MEAGQVHLRNSAGLRSNHLHIWSLSYGYFLALLVAEDPSSGALLTKTSDQALSHCKPLKLSN